MRRGLTAAGPRRPHLCGLRFFVLRRLTPAVPASSPPPGPALPPHTHRQSPTRRHKRPTLACPTTSSPAPKPTAHTHLLPRLPAPPSPTDTKKRLPAPEPPPYIRILARTIRPPNRLGKSTLFLPRLPRPRRPEKRRPAPLSAPTHTPAPGKSSGARPHTSASSPTCTSLRLPAHAPHPSSPSRHPATPEKTSPRIPPAASPRLPAPPSASPPRQAQKKRQPAKGCRASFKPPGD